MHERPSGAADPTTGAPVRVAVVDPVPAYRAGLLAHLSAEGFDCGQDDVEGAGGHPARQALLVTIRSEREWAVLDRYGHDCSGAVVVALLLDTSTASYLDALRSGACGAVPFDAPLDRIVAVLRAALDEHALLPLAAAQALASGNGSRTADWITETEASWLRRLTTGMTIARLAEEVGYSERSLYRLLHDLYGRMQVSNRTEAIAKAVRLGIIDA